MSKLPNSLGWRKGQLILVMSITLTVVILSVATIIYLTSTQHLFFNYNPSREIVLSIDADFQRVLTRILAHATAQYNKTREIDTDIDEMREARILANKTFSYWFLSTQAAYAGKGLNMETWWIDEPIQGEKTMTLRIGWVSKQGGSGYEDHAPQYSVRTLQNRLLKLFWYRPNSISAIGAGISIDSTAQGVIGWRNTHIILLNLTITSIWSNEKDGFVYYNVVVLRENGEPVNDLRKENFEPYWFDPTAPAGVYWWRRAGVDDIVLTYNGGGNYTITLKPNFLDQSHKAKDKRDSFWSWGTNKPGYYQFAIVRVKDSRDIIVEAYSYPGIEYVIQENAIEPYYPNNPAKTKETYVFELLPNGTMYWFNTILKSSSSNYNPPVPLPPVKQMRVLATVNYNKDPDTFVEVPYQVEVWNDKYLWPSSTNFLGWRKRFMNGSKLVFSVNYPPGCQRQKVRIVWLDDCDAEIPEYRVEMKISGGLGRVDTGSYILWIVVDREEASRHFVHVDWSISLRDRFNVSHVEYILTAYDSYRLGNTYYIPIKFPEDKWNIVPAPDSEGVARAPARIVAFRKSDRVVYTSPHPQLGQEVRDEIEYNDMIYIPYNVSYFLYYTNASWKKNVEISYSYLVFAGMIGGYPHDSYISQTIQRFKWGSLLTIDGDIVNGTFNNQARYTPHRGYALGTSYGHGNYSYWVALYNESWGTSIFASQQLVDLLRQYGKTYKKEGKEVDQLFVWTRSLGASRFMEYDAIRLEANLKTTIDNLKTPKVEFKFAGFMIGGGIAEDNSKYNNDKDWHDGGGTYARPFRVLYDPELPVISDILLDKRSAFAFDDFSQNPFSTGKFVTPNPSAWAWDQANGWIRGTSPEGSFTVAYCKETIKPNTGVVHVLAKKRHVTSAINQYSGLTMLSSESSFYMLGFYRERQGNDYNYRRLGIWSYPGWSRLARTTNTRSLSLPDNSWFFFYGNRTLQGTGQGSMGIRVYDSAGNPVSGASLRTTDTAISVSLVGLGVRDQDAGGGTIRADFDFFVACADADPGKVTVKNVRSGYTVIIRDKNGNTVAHATATSSTVTLNVLTNAVIMGGSIQIQNREGNVLFTKAFDEIVGGDTYTCVTSSSAVNPAKECSMYYRMFTCRDETSGGVQDMPTIIDIRAAY